MAGLGTLTLSLTFDYSMNCTDATLSYLVVVSPINENNVSASYNGSWLLVTVSSITIASNYSISVTAILD